MFIFQDPADVDELEQIENRANPPAASVGAPLFLTVGLGGMGLFLTGSPIVGGSLAALPAYALVKKLNRVWKNNVFLRRNPGCYAHLIRNDRDMIAWIESHGKDEVADQLLLAIRQGQRLTSCAKRTAQVLIPPEQVPPKKVTAYLTTESPVNVESRESPSLDSAHPKTESPVANPIQSTGQDQDASQKPYKSGKYFDSATGKGSIVLDLVIQSPGLSRLMIGGQRTGKSYFAAVASRELTRSLGWKIFHINLASYGAEDSYYWQHAYKSVCGDLSSITNEQEAYDLIAYAIDCITEFINSKGAILIVDEVTFTGSKYGKWDASKFLRLVAEQISALTSSGMKRERVIWALCPELVAGAMKESAKAIKSLKLLYFAIVPSLAIDWQGQKIGFDGELHKQINANYDGVGLPSTEQMSLCRRHKLPRIAYLNGEWLPIGDLPKIEQPTVAKPSAYAVVSALPIVEPTTIEAELPSLYEAVARMTIAQTFEQPGKIHSNGTKEPINPASVDPIEAAILEFLKSRVEGATAGRIRADKKSLKSVPLADIEFYLSVLVEEGKIQQDGTLYFSVDLVDL
jgi:hypothetical protein